MSEQEMDKIISSAKQNKAFELFTKFSLSQYQNVKCSGCLKDLPEGSIFVAFVFFEAPETLKGNLRSEKKLSSNERA